MRGTRWHRGAGGAGGASAESERGGSHRASGRAKGVAESDRSGHCGPIASLRSGCRDVRVAPCNDDKSASIIHGRLADRTSAKNALSIAYEHSVSRRENGKRGPFSRESSFPGSISLDRRPPFYPGEQITRNRVRGKPPGRRGSRTLNAHDGSSTLSPRSPSQRRQPASASRRPSPRSRSPPPASPARASRSRWRRSKTKRPASFRYEARPQPGHGARERTPRARILIDTRVNAREARSARAPAGRVARNARALRAVYQNPRAAFSRGCRFLSPSGEARRRWRLRTKDALNHSSRIDRD